MAAAYREDSRNREKAYILFRDLAISGNSIYALVSTLTPPHQILRFEVEMEEIVFKEVWQIHDDVFITDLAYDGGANIYIYDGKSNELGTYNFFTP